MKVMLTTDIKGVGKRGQVVEAAEGYCRNFLMPKGYAVPPGHPEAAKIQRELERVQRSAQAEVAQIKQLAKSLTGQQVNLTAKAQTDQPGAKLFGAIHAAEVAKALGIDKKLVQMEPIKELGSHVVNLELPHRVGASVTVVVTAAS